MPYSFEELAEIVKKGSKGSQRLISKSERGKYRIHKLGPIMGHFYYASEDQIVQKFGENRITKFFRCIGAIIRGNRMYRMALKSGPPPGWSGSWPDIDWKGDAK